MSQAIAPAMPSEGRIFTKETLIKGKPARIQCIEIGGQTFSIARGPLTVVSLEDEWYEDLANPQAVIDALKENAHFRPDLLTFWQRMPDVEPKYSYHQEWEEIAVLPVTSYDNWWKKQINSKTRNLIRKAEKVGVVVKETLYDDNFVSGMTTIFNEEPIRQGRRFWHYGKDFETVKSQFSRFVFREYMIAAYYQDEMVGFVMLGDAGKFALLGQILGSIRHRDKSPTNALMAKAVEVCAAHGLGYLIYYFWGDNSLAAFKRHNGFEKVMVPRYYVSLTWKGKLALRCGAYHGWKELLPTWIKNPLKRLRKRWYESRTE